ncbi:THADA [Branchiostoma lanceolatum]|uniref:tRNA (32-2'-O)-methyltransferase regulator THADA n=1 Tax=Branchiostoma lanceolatum TaxID=7740 RepID=A0A8J9VGW2_BRALA|nr:THADA [Branchiostoma lanceolatum]
MVSRVPIKAFRKSDVLHQSMQASDLHVTNMEEPTSVYQALRNKLEAVSDVPGPARLLLQCLENSNVTQQAIMLKTLAVGAKLKEAASDTTLQSQTLVCVDVLVSMYLQCTVHSSLRGTLVSMQQGLPPELKTQAVDKLSAQIKDLLVVPSVRLRYSINVLGLLLENFPLGAKVVAQNLPAVLNFVKETLEVLLVDTKDENTAKSSQAMQDCTTVLKLLTALLQKCQADILALITTDHDNQESYLLADITRILHAILQFNSVLQACHSSAGIALPATIRTLLLNDNEATVKAIFALLYPNHSTEFVNDIKLSPLKTFLQSCDAKLPSFSHLCLCKGILAKLNPEMLSTTFENKCLLFDVILPDILSLCNKLSDSTSVLHGSYALTVWSAKALELARSATEENIRKQLILPSSPAQQVLGYIWQNWDHPLDGIRHQCREIFRNVLKCHVKVSNSPVREDADLLDLTKKVLSEDWHKRGKYVALCCLTEEIGAQKILQLCPQIVTRLLILMSSEAVTASVHAKELHGKLSKSHKDQLTSQSHDEGISKWQESWIDPVLDLLCNTSTSVNRQTISDCLSGLLKTSPESMDFIIGRLTTDEGSLSKKSDANLCGLIACLKTAHSLRIQNLQTHSSATEMMLKKALTHSKDQVRLSSLSLLCESHKQTDPIPGHRLSLVLHFLKYNLNSQSPSFRQQTCSSLKKLFICVRDSSFAALRSLRQQKKKSAKETPQSETPQAAKQLKQYKEFLGNVFEMLFQGIGVGASFARKATCLSLLSIMLQNLLYHTSSESIAEVFPLSAMFTSKHFHILLECLADTYEPNKQFGLELLTLILKNTSSSSVHLKENDHLCAVLFGICETLMGSVNPHDSVTAAYILRLLLQHSVDSLYAKEWKLVENSSQMVKLAKPSHSTASVEQSVKDDVTNSFSILASLVGKLKTLLKHSKDDLLEVAANCPIYGVIHCIRALLADVDMASLVPKLEWGNLLDEIIVICCEVSSIVSPIVQTAAPEGYVPEGATLDEAVTQVSLKPVGKDDDTMSQEPSSVSSQALLICCWRSLMEISLLFGQFAQKAPLYEEDDDCQGLLSVQQVLKIGDYFTTQLLEARHLGAFEKGKDGFLKLCHRLWRSEIPDLRKLPCDWLTGLLSSLHNYSDSSLCATRRSAGLPLFFECVLTTEPEEHQHAQLKSSMGQLLSLASSLPLPTDSKHTVPIVHALNILKALFKNAKLGENIFPYIIDGVKVTILGFGSEVWAIRNASTLLFSILMTRIFGVKRGKDEHARRNCMSGREFFARFPSLHPFLLDQLQLAVERIQSCESSVDLHPSLYPVLILLAKLYPSPMDGASSTLNMSAFVPLVQKCAHSTVMKTRAMAAQALLPLIPAGQAASNIGKLLQQIEDTPGIPQNSVHGILLQAQGLIKTCCCADIPGVKQEDLESEVYPSLKSLSWIGSRSNPCAVTRALYIETVEFLIFDSSVGEGSHQLQKLRTTLMETLCTEPQEDLSNICGAAALNVGVAQFVLKCLPHSGKGITNSVVKPAGLLLKLLTSKYYEVRQKTLEFLNSNIAEQQNCQTANGKTLEAKLNGTADTVTVKDQDLSKLEITERLLNSSRDMDTEVDGRLHQLLGLCTEERVIQQLVAMTMQTERNSEVLPHLLQLMCTVMPLKPFPWTITTPSVKQVTCGDLLQTLVRLGQESTIKPELQSALVSLSSITADLLYTSSDQQVEVDTLVLECLADWVGLMLVCAQPGKYVEVRQAVAKGLAAVRGMLEDEGCLLGDLSLILWRALLTLLQDEDEATRQTAASCVLLLSNNKQETSVSIQPTLALHETVEFLLLSSGKKKWHPCILLLHDLVTGNPDLEDVFPDGQITTEVVFEKGETNTYEEGVELAGFTAPSLTQAVGGSPLVDADAQSDLHDTTSTLHQHSSSISVQELPVDTSVILALIEKDKSLLLDLCRRCSSLKTSPVFVYHSLYGRVCETLFRLVTALTALLSCPLLDNTFVAGTVDKVVDNITHCTIYQQPLPSPLVKHALVRLQELVK